ncbi:MAG: efflux RND transporter periplasmic adaptor subunit [Agarilytica sp.]
MLRHTFSVILSAYLIVCAAGALAQAKQAQKKALNVKVVRATNDVFYDRAEALGTLKANESVVLTVNVSETISSIHFKDGQKVEKGGVLVEMVSSEEHALLVEAQTNQLESKRQLERIQSLVKAGTASESTLDQRQRDYDSAQARYRATQSRLKDRVVLAPFSGVVGLRNVSVGALVRPGDVITTLTDDSKMKLDFAVPSIFLPVIKNGLPITATTRVYPDMKFEGVVTSIDNQIDRVTRAITIRAMLPNSAGLLKQGMLMNVDVLMNQRKNIVLPEEALLPKANENYVFVAIKKDQGFVAQKRKVTVASRREGEVEVSEGLSLGDLVVTHGAFKIKPGASIRFELPVSELPVSEKAKVSTAP